MAGPASNRPGGAKCHVEQIHGRENWLATGGFVAY